MKAFLCSIDDIVWDAVEAGWTGRRLLNPLGIKQPLWQLMLTVKP